MNIDIYDESFHGLDELPLGRYETCSFHKCNFSGVDFSHYVFIDCTFIDCDLSLIKTNKLAFRNIHFKGSKMMGINFGLCNKLGLSFIFHECNLSHSIFNELKIPDTDFNACILHHVDFSNTHLKCSSFRNCDLLNSTFDFSMLEKVDFSSSNQVQIQVETCKMKGSKFAQHQLIGLLQKYGIEVVS